MKEISIVIPVYNSQDTVHLISEKIKEALKDFDYEQIMVNDCSRDNSWEEIKKEADVNSNLIGINLRKNSGQDSAILAGLNYAKGNWIVIMDDDLQHSPSDIIKLYNEVKKGYDVCYANFEHKKQKFWKNAGSWFNGKVSEIVINKPKNIYLSPFKIMNKSVVKEIIKFNNLFPYIDGLIFQITNKITQIDIEHHEREIGKSNYSLIKSMKVFFRMLFGFSTKPLTFAAYTGFFVSILGFILLVKYFVDYLMGKADVAGWTTIVILILFIGGLLLMSIGIIGVYIGRTYLTINNTPKFLVGEKTYE